MTLNEVSDIDVELKERYGSPDGQDVSIDGMNILLFYKISWYFRRKQGRIQECLIGGGGGGGPNFGSERTVELFCGKLLLHTLSHQSQLHVIIPWPLIVYLNSWIVKDAALEFSLVAKCNALFVKKKNRHLRKSYTILSIRCKNLSQTSVRSDRGGGRTPGSVTGKHISFVELFIIMIMLSFPSLHDYDVKIPIFTFCGEREPKTSFLLFLSFRIQLQEKCQHLTN